MQAGKLGQLDAIVNIIGSDGRSGESTAPTEDEWEWTMTVNRTGVFLAPRVVVPTSCGTGAAGSFT
jgi:NADP-dependent 3-hydroxy acid dehydrogenase YdfG